MQTAVFDYRMLSGNIEGDYGNAMSLLLENWRARMVASRPYATRTEAFDDAAERGRQDHRYSISVFHIYLADKLRRKASPAALCLSPLSACHVDA
jgi:hypothetical protein